MKQSNENLPTTTTSDCVTCNGHDDEQHPAKIRQESDADESINPLASPNSVSDGVVPSTSPMNTTNDLIVLPEISFNIRIQCPGIDVFELPVTSSELVQEIHQVLMDKEETCHRTCFSVQLDGTVLDNFTELKNIENLKDGSLLKVVEGE